MQSPEVIAEIIHLAVACYSRAAIAEQVGATLSVRIELDPDRGGVSWEHLEPARACCWPLHDGWWCGAPKAAGSSYCSEHDVRSRAYAPEREQHAAPRIPRFAAW